MSQPSLILRRSLKKTLWNLFLFLMAEAAASFLFFFFYLPFPQSFGEKLFAALSCCVYMIGSLFLLGSILNGIRNLIEPSVVFSSESFWFTGMVAPVSLSEISSVSVSGEDGAVLLVFCGELRYFLRQKDCQLPLYTVVKALSFRMEDFKRFPEDKKNAG